MYSIDNLMYSAGVSGDKECKGQDIKVTNNELELEDDLLGLVDSTRHSNYLSLTPGMVYHKP
jgi:hypothetical protein